MQLWKKSVKTTFSEKKKWTEDLEWRKHLSMNENIAYNKIFYKHINSVLKSGKITEWM
jgi:hypothetical protein